MISTQDLTGTTPVKPSRRKNFSGALLVSALLLSSGCGGGGGGGSENPGGDDGGVDTCGSWPTFHSLDDLSGNSGVLAVATLDKCNIVIAGYEGSTSVGQVEGNSRGFVRRVQLADSGVQSVWHYVVDTNGSDAINTLSLNGNELRFTGYVSGALPGQASAGKKDVVVGRLSLDGDTLAVAQLGNERPNTPLRWLSAASGEQLLVGNDEVHVPTNFVERWEDPWIAGITAAVDTFTLDWLNNLDSAEGDHFGAAVLADYTLVLGLNSGGGASAGISLQGRNLTGDLHWYQHISASPYDAIADIQLQADGTLLALGSTYLSLDGSAQGNADYFLLQVEPGTGLVTGINQFGSSRLDWAKVLLIDSHSQRRVVLGEESANGSAPWSLAMTVLDSSGNTLSVERKLWGSSTGVAGGTLSGADLFAVGSYRPEGQRETGYVYYRRLPG